MPARCARESRSPTASRRCRNFRSWRRRALASTTATHTCTSPRVWLKLRRESRGTKSSARNSAHRLGSARKPCSTPGPGNRTGTTNPLIAAGLQMTMNEYAKVLELEYHRGVYRGQRLISDALFTAQATEPYPKAVIGDSPMQRVGLDYHYGLANWLECPPPAVNCPVQTSPGAFGFTPWVDRDWRLLRHPRHGPRRPAHRRGEVLGAAGRAAAADDSRGDAAVIARSRSS